jgi:isocitrate/isopropylmalate dehydrogenase
MLRHLKEEAAADRVDVAIRAAIGAGESTRDLGGSLGTSEFADAVIRRLN